MSQNTINRTEKEKFLDNYFLDQLQKLAQQISSPDLGDRKEQLAYILDSLMTLADEYQAVMLEKEEGYWASVEMWQDELRQRKALEWVNENLK